MANAASREDPAGGSSDEGLRLASKRLKPGGQAPLSGVRSARGAPDGWVLAEHARERRAGELDLHDAQPPSPLGLVGKNLGQLRFRIAAGQVKVADCLPQSGAIP
jgi:hypothetical protein